MSEKKKDTKPSPIKKVPLITGAIFVLAGLCFLPLVFTSPEITKSVYAFMVVSLLGFGVNYLDKSGIFER